MFSQQLSACVKCKNVRRVEGYLDATEAGTDHSEYKHLKYKLMHTSAHINKNNNFLKLWRGDGF